MKRLLAAVFIANLAVGSVGLQYSCNEAALTDGKVVRYVLGDPDGPWDDSHASGLLEYPHYTRPPEFRGWGVPEILLSGDHGKIARWRREQSLLRTFQRRPDLLEKAELSKSDREFLERIKAVSGKL